MTVASLRKLHLLRHSPAENILKFIYECIPRNLNTHEIVVIFLRNCREWLKKIISSCVGCALNGNRTALTHSVPTLCPAFHIGMLDICVLNSKSQLCCLVIVDLGSGIPAIQVIDAQPPDARSVLIAYVVGWAARRGAHRELIADRDGIFRAFKFIRLIEQLGAKKPTTGAGHHESMAQAERLIRTIQYSIDRHRDNASDSIKPITQSGHFSCQCWKTVFGTSLKELRKPHPVHANLGDPHICFAQHSQTHQPPLRRNTTRIRTFFRG